MSNKSVGLRNDNFNRKENSLLYIFTPLIFSLIRKTDSPLFPMETGHRGGYAGGGFLEIPDDLQVFSGGRAVRQQTKDGSIEDIEILVYWDEQHEDGYVTGYRSASTEGIGVAERNLRRLEEGDTLDFFCDYYNYQEEYEGSYYFGDTLTVQGELQVTYEEMGEYPTEICYYLQDIYRNEYWTETIAITFESP